MFSNTKHFNNKRHIDNLIESSFYLNLAKLRNLVELSCDCYFQKLGAIKVDLFLITKSISSPTGKGSDSKPLPLKFGNDSAYLADSAQFGMEPFVLKPFNIVYCYLPSFRGEESDNRHLNQFYHCEAEMKGKRQEAMKIAENLVKHVAKSVYEGSVTKKIDLKKQEINHILYCLDKKFPTITFDEAEKVLRRAGDIKEFIKFKEYGRVLKNKGELALAKIVGNNKLPVWVTNYDRNVVPFYQKPDPKNTERVLNADLLFPSIDGCLGGEIIGLGQRQDKVQEISESLNRQNVVNKSNYDWYVKLRRHPNYTSTSGFGLGIERLLSWFLLLDNIIDTSLFPVVKNIKTVY